MYNPTIIQFGLAVAITVIAYLLYRFILGGRISERLDLPIGSARQVTFHRLTGAVLFGFVPLLVILSSGTGLDTFGFTFPTSGTFLWTLVFAAVIIPMNYYNARSPENLEMYPQIRRDVWSVKLLASSTLSWTVYLAGYEFLFRGYLLFSAIPVIGLWPAIGLNVVLYSLVHIHKGAREMIGAVPLGFVVCYLSYITGSFWVALFIHMVLALTNEWFSIIRNPRMVIKLAWK